MIGFLELVGVNPGRSRPAIYRLSDKVFEQTGYIEGRNVIVEYRWTQGQYDRAPALSVDLVPRQVSVLVANSLPLTLAAKAATTTNSDYTPDHHVAARRKIR